MSDNPEDICPRPSLAPPTKAEPLVPPLHLAAVYRCHDPAEADALMSGREPGYVYARDGHPGADVLAERCRELHAADRAAVCSSGMAALALVVLATLERGDHVVTSEMLYGRTLNLFTAELPRLGMTAGVVDPCDLEGVRRALAAQPTSLLVVETISNPLLRVVDLAALAKIARAAGASLLVDNTLAGPAICRPLGFGADWVVESLTKAMSGHSDVVLGLVCGRDANWSRVPTAMSTWGLTSSPMDCWLAMRGLGTYALRARQSMANAQTAATMLAGRGEVSRVSYPGLSDHADHALAARQFDGGFGSLVTFTLTGGRAAADRFIRAAKAIPFCPSLGDLSTTLSHPESTSHRGLAADERRRLGIDGGTIRLSLGIESSEAVLTALEEGLAAV